MASQPDTPVVQRTKAAALQQVEGKTVKEWKYADGGGGIVLYFSDGTNLQIDITYDREIVGLQSGPFLIAHFGSRSKRYG
jgi:uncharacterized protein with LGFP repeats